MSTPPATDRCRDFVEQLLRLRAVGAFAPQEDAKTRGIHRWRFRAGGWPVDVDLDTTVLELRVYHGRDEVAMGRVPERAMAMLLGREPVPADGARPDADAVVAELRRLVADWKSKNARIFIRPPVKVGHPDHGNRA